MSELASSVAAEEKKKLRGISERVMGKQLFLSHTWAVGDGGLDVHARVVAIGRALERLGWSVWVDDVDMCGSIDACMASGIDGAEAVLVFATRRYVAKVNGAARDGRDDNCLKEFTYALWREKTVVPVILESRMLCARRWPAGVVPMRLASVLYVDAVGCSPGRAAARVHAQLTRNGHRPCVQVGHRTADVPAPRAPVAAARRSRSLLPPALRLPRLPASGRRARAPPQPRTERELAVPRTTVRV